VRVVFMGTPEFAVPSLEHLVLNRHQVAAVYTRPDRPAGRGRALVSSPVKRAARARGLTVAQPASFKEAEAVAQLADLHPDVVVVAAFGQILPRAVLDIPAHGCVNIHPSLLPRFRGVSPVAAAILSGDEFTGVSIMLLDEGVDTGPVLARAQVPVSPLDTTGSLTAGLSLVAAHLLMETLSGWLRGEITPRPQEEAEATYSGMMSKEEGEVDWRLPAVDIWRRVRAFQPWPGCYTRWRGRQLKIIEAVPMSGGGGLDAGRVVALNEKGAAFGIGTGDGVLGVLRVQLEGKRAMPAAEFLRGQRQLTGAILPSG
jgi:methionyl-tRNA formyltransferase